MVALLVTTPLRVRVVVGMALIPVPVVVMVDYRGRVKGFRSNNVGCAFLSRFRYLRFCCPRAISSLPVAMIGPAQGRQYRYARFSPFVYSMGTSVPHPAQMV